MTFAIPYRQLNGYALGDASSFTNGANKTAADITAATSKIPTGSGSKTDAGKAAGYASIVGGVAIVVGEKLLVLSPTFGPAAPLVAAAGAVIVAASALIIAIAGTSKAKQLKEESGQYEASNAQIRLQIDQVSNQSNVVANALQTLGIKLKETGFAGFDNELGSIFEDIFSSGATTAAQNQLTSAKSENELLKKILAQETDRLQGYISKFNNLLDAITIEGQNKTFIKKVILWSLGGMTALGLGYLGYQAIKK